MFDLNDSGYINLGPHDKWGQRSVEYALLTHKTTGKKIDHFNTHFCVCTDTISDCCGQEGQYQSAKEVEAAMDLHRRTGLFVLKIICFYFKGWNQLHHQPVLKFTLILPAGWQEKSAGISKLVDD